MIERASAERTPTPGDAFTVEIDGLPCMSAKAVGWHGDPSSDLLTLDNGLTVRTGRKSDTGPFRNWTVDRKGILAGYLSVRFAIPGDEILIAAISGDDAAGPDLGPVKPGSSGLRLAEWGTKRHPGPSRLMSILPTLAELFVSAEDEQEASNSAANLSMYMNRRFGPPNVGFEPRDMPYGAWTFATPIDDLFIEAAPYEILPLQIRAFVSDETQRRLLRAWDAATRALYHGGDGKGLTEFADLVAPYRRVLRRCVLDLMHPVEFKEDPIDPFGYVSGWRFAAAGHEDRIRPAKPHPLSAMALPPQLTAHAELFEEFLRLASEAPGGAKATLGRIVRDLRPKPGA